MTPCKYDVLARNKSTGEYYVEEVNAANEIHAYEIAVSNFVLVEKICRSDLEIISVKRKGR